MIKRLAEHTLLTAASTIIIAYSWYLAEFSLIHLRAKLFRRD